MGLLVVASAKSSVYSVLKMELVLILAKLFQTLVTKNVIIELDSNNLIEAPSSLSVLEKLGEIFVEPSRKFQEVIITHLME